jgi:excisionase family DNA binding protein
MNGEKAKVDFSNKRVLTFEEGCEYLGYAKSYVYKLTSAGILPYSKPNGKSIFFDREKLEGWMLSNANTSHEEKQTEAATYVTTHQ